LVVSFIVTQQKGLFSESVAGEWEQKLIDNQEYTDKFLEPFQKVVLLEESTNESGDKFTPWIQKGKFFEHWLVVTKNMVIANSR